MNVGKPSTLPDKTAAYYTPEGRQGDCCSFCMAEQVRSPLVSFYWERGARMHNSIPKISKRQEQKSLRSGRLAHEWLWDLQTSRIPRNEIHWLNQEHAYLCGLLPGRQLFFRIVVAVKFGCHSIWEQPTYYELNYTKLTRNNFLNIRIFRDCFC